MQNMRKDNESHMLDILIPTCKEDYEISEIVGEIISSTEDINVIYTCRDASAAINRNTALERATSDILIMMDDDMTGFYDGWAQELIKPMVDDESVVMVSARLMKRDGITPNHAMGAMDKPTTGLVEVVLAPTACIAIRNDGIRFDENFIGSGWEDTDYIYQLKKKYPNGKIILNNNVKLIHINEMKNQHTAGNYEMNRNYFNQKWGVKHA